MAAFAQVTHTPVAPTQGTHACEAQVEESSIDVHALVATLEEVGWSEGEPARRILSLHATGGSGVAKTSLLCFLPLGTGPGPRDHVIAAPRDWGGT